VVCNEFYATTNQETFDLWLVNFGNMLLEKEVFLVGIHENTSLQKYLESLLPTGLKFYLAYYVKNYTEYSVHMENENEKNGILILQVG
jgi:hypothetical protein